MLINIIGNAIKFGPENSEVIVGFTDSDPVEIRVRDDGPGMTRRQIERSMQPYGRGPMESSRTAPSIGGTGLGLPIARRLVDLHGGQLRIESVPGTGTTVVVTLPRERAITDAA